MNVAGKDLADDKASNSSSSEEQSIFKKLTLLILGILPWAIVAALLWAGIFIKPEAVIEKVVSDPINVRDNIFGAAYLGGETYLAAGNYGKMLITIDNGKNWKDQNSTVVEHLQDVSAWDKDRAVAVGNAGVVIITEDGGKTWASVDAPLSDVANKLLKVHTYPGGEALAVGEMGMIMRSMDYGKTWKRLREETDIFMNDVVKVDANTIYATAEFGQMYKSVDNGATWEEILTDSPNSFTAIDARNPQEIVTVGLAGVVVGTQDGGETWTYITPEQSGMTEHLMDIQWSDAINRWVTIGNKGKWMTFKSDLTDFKPMNISNTDYTSHTEIVIVGDKGLAVGATVGSLDLKTGVWTLYAE